MANNKTKIFHVDLTSDDTGEHFQGQFTTKKLSIMDQTLVARRKSELGGGLYCDRDDNGNPTGRGISDNTEMLNYMLALCEVAVIQAPEWWNVKDVSDEDLLYVVFKEVTDYQNSFRKRPRGSSSKDDADGSSEEDSAAPNAQANTGDNAPKVVDSKVQADLDA